MATEQKSYTLFEYSIFWTPNAEESKEGKKPRIIVEPKTILAADEKTAYMLAIREIPADMSSDLNQITIAMRPF